MSKRIYITVDDDIFEEGSELAKNMGMSLSKLVHYSFLLMLKHDEKNRYNTQSIPALYSTLNNAIKNMSKGEKFIVSALFDEDVWTNLSSSEKRSISQYLRHFKDNNPGIIKTCGKVGKNITQYEKL